MTLFPPIILLAMLGTGMICGLYFTMDNAVLPNLLRLNDKEYFRVFQKISKAIHTPFYYILLFGAHLFQLLACLLSFLYGSTTQMYLLISAAVIYGLGVIATSMRKVIPLQTEIETTVNRNGNEEFPSGIRRSFEQRWKRYNRIRILAALVSALLLLAVALWV